MIVFSNSPTYKRAYRPKSDQNIQMVFDHNAHKNIYI
jgi:hypothetical protein